MLAEQFHEQALEIWRKMLYDNKRKIAVGWHVVEKFADRFEATRRSTDGHNIVILICTGLFRNTIILHAFSQTFLFPFRRTDIVLYNKLKHKTTKLFCNI